MSATTIQVKTTSDTKAHAEKIAKKLGMSLNGILDSYLKQFIRTKGANVVGTEEIPNNHLRQSLLQSEKDIKAGRTLSFTSGKDALEYLAQEIEDEKRSAH